MVFGTRTARPAEGALAAKVGIGLLALAVAAAVALGVGLVVSGGGPEHSTATPPTGSTGGTATTTPGPTPGLRLTTPPPAAAVLAAATAAPAVSLADLRTAVAGDLGAHSFGRHLAFAVAQLGRPEVHWASGQQVATPASTLKLLTTTAALSTLGPDHRFTTTVRPGQASNSIVLVGGGDPLLTVNAEPQAGDAPPYPAQASLETLASDTAAALLTDDVRRVRLGYDATLFSGPAVNPRWPSTYLPDNVVSPISALWVDEGRETAGFAERSADPARAAADDFAALLRKDGITVLGDVVPARPAAASQPMAEVSSAPLQQIVQHTLEQSDNEAAEVLLRQVAIAGGSPGSFTAGVRAVQTTLSGLGLSVQGAVLYDGSGLSRDDVVPVSLLLQTLALDAAPAHPELRGVLTGLPVAGFSGSLGYRFEDDAATGLGYVRAKTGTLTGVHALAGLALTKHGQTIAFVAIADRVPVPQTLQARADLDQIAADIASCGC